MGVDDREVFDRDKYRDAFKNLGLPGERFHRRPPFGVKSCRKRLKLLPWRQITGIAVIWTIQ